MWRAGVQTSTKWRYPMRASERGAKIHENHRLISFLGCFELRLIASAPPLQKARGFFFYMYND